MLFEFMIMFMDTYTLLSMRNIKCNGSSSLELICIYAEALEELDDTNPLRPSTRPRTALRSGGGLLSVEPLRFLVTSDKIEVQAPIKDPTSDAERVTAW
jgi:hypothetical protein